MLSFNNFSEIIKNFAFLKFYPETAEDIKSKFSGFKIIENDIGDDVDLAKGFAMWARHNDIFPTHIDIKEVLYQNRLADQAINKSLETTAKFGITEGRSAEIVSTKITPKQRKYLNKMYWDAVDANPMRNVIKNYERPDRQMLEEKHEIILWLGRQYGDMIVRSVEVENKFKRKEKISATQLALSTLQKHFGIDNDLATKYLLLNNQGFFHEEKSDTITKHWLRRTGINLSDYKKLIEQCEQEQE